MKKTIIIIFAIILFLVLALGSVAFSQIVDTRYSTNFERVMQSYSIEEIDQYFSEDTLIICGERSDTYKNLRSNVEKACLAKNYEILTSYGGSEDLSVFGEKEYGMIFYGTLNGENIGEGLATITLKIMPLFHVFLVSVECNDPIFAYIFFGEE